MSSEQEKSVFKVQNLSTINTQLLALIIIIIIKHMSIVSSIQLFSHLFP